MSQLTHILAKHYNFKTGQNLTAGVLYLPNTHPDRILANRLEALQDKAFLATLTDGEKAILEGDGGEKLLRDRIKQLEAFVQSVVDNAPKEEPRTVTPRTLAHAWGFWFAGQKAESLLPSDNSSSQE